MSSEIMERFSAIKKAKEMIASLEVEKVKEKVVCPNCGAKTAVGMNYCGSCGTNLNVN